MTESETTAPLSLNAFPTVRIVLVETTHPGNIGAAARAMKNMGLTNLVLVNPREFPHEKATWRSASASDVVESATVVATVEEAIEGCQLVVGTSARDRRIPWPLLEPRECGQKVAAAAAADAPVAILFGREAHGLKNEELHLCHYHVNIPTSKAYSSLNLAMAVQVIAYEILLSGRGQAPEAPWDMDFATAESVELLVRHLEETLIEVGFHDPDNPRQLMTRLRRLLTRVRLDSMEVNILRGFLTAVQQKIQPK